MLALPAVALVAGAAAPGALECKQVVPGEVVLKGKDGKIRVRLAADPGGNGPQVYSPLAQWKAVLAADQNKQNGVGFVEFNAEGAFNGGVGGNVVEKSSPRGGRAARPGRPPGRAAAGGQGRWAWRPATCTAVPLLT